MLLTEIQANRTRLDNHDTRFDQIDSELDQLKKDFAARTEKYEKQITYLENTITTMQNQRSSAESGSETTRNQYAFPKQGQRQQVQNITSGRPFDPRSAKIGNIGIGETNEAAVARAKECLSRVGTFEAQVAAVAAFKTNTDINMCEVIFVNPDDIAVTRLNLQYANIHHIEGKPVWIAQSDPNAKSLSKMVDSALAEMTQFYNWKFSDEGSSVTVKDKYGIAINNVSMGKFVNQQWQWSFASLNRFESIVNA